MDTRERRKASEIVREHMRAMEQKNFDKARQYLTDDFTFAGPLPKPVGAQEYIGVHQALLGGLQDWNYNFKVLHEDPDKVVATVRITAKHLHDLTLPMMPEVGTIHSTGKRIQLPEEKLEISLRGDKIAKVHVDKVPNGGVMGIVSQLKAGVKVPA